MNICIDTNIYSAFKKGDTQITELLETCDRIYIPAVVLGELYAGFYLGARPKENLKELELFLSYPGVRIIDSDQDIADNYGHLVSNLKKQGTPIPTNDIWIAAAAMKVGAKLATFDSHFNTIQGLVKVVL